MKNLFCAVVAVVGVCATASCDDSALLSSNPHNNSIAHNGKAINFIVVIVIVDSVRQSASFFMIVNSFNLRSLSPDAFLKSPSLI